MITNYYAFAKGLIHDHENVRYVITNDYVVTKV